MALTQVFPVVVLTVVLVVVLGSPDPQNFPTPVDSSTNDDGTFPPAAFFPGMNGNNGNQFPGIGRPFPNVPPGVPNGFGYFGNFPPIPSFGPGNFGRFPGFNGIPSLPFNYFGGYQLYPIGLGNFPGNNQLIPNIPIPSNQVVPNESSGASASTNNPATANGNATSA